MTRSSSLVDRPVLRLLLLALMGLALASRLALGATLPVVGDGASAIGPLAKLQAEMIMCHTGHDGAPAPPLPRGLRSGRQHARFGRWPRRSVASAPALV
jgi:hypothetical protein